MPRQFITIILPILVIPAVLASSSGHNQHRSCKVCSESIALQHCKWQCGEEHLESRYGKIDGYESKANANGSCLLLLFEPNCTNFTLNCQQNDGTKTHEVAQYHCEESLTWWQILLIVIGVCFAVSLIAYCCYILCKRRKKSKTGISNAAENGNASGISATLLPPKPDPVAIEMKEYEAQIQAEHSVTNGNPKFTLGNAEYCDHEDLNHLQ